MSSENFCDWSDSESVSNLDFDIPKGRRRFGVTHLELGGEIIETTPGTYSSVTPAGAARKVANMLCKQFGDKDALELTGQISVKELLDGQDGKISSYEFTRKKHDIFSGASFGSRFIPFQYSLAIKSIKNTEPIRETVQDPVQPVESVIEQPAEVVKEKDLEQLSMVSGILKWLGR